MRKVRRTNFNARLALFLFAYGGIVNLLMFRALAWPSELPSDILVGAGMLVLGGAVTLAVFYRPAHNLWIFNRATLMRGALLGVLATLIVIELYLFLFAAFAIAPGWRDLIALPPSTQLDMIGLTLISVHTYNLALVFFLLPVGLVQGAVAGSSSLASD